MQGTKVRKMISFLFYLFINVSLIPLSTINVSGTRVANVPMVSMVRFANLETSTMRKNKNAVCNAKMVAHAEMELRMFHSLRILDRIFHNTLKNITKYFNIVFAPRDFLE